MCVNVGVINRLPRRQFLLFLFSSVTDCLQLDFLSYFNATFHPYTNKNALSYITQNTFPLVIFLANVFDCFMLFFCSFTSLFILTELEVCAEINYFGTENKTW